LSECFPGDLQLMCSKHPSVVIRLQEKKLAEKVKLEKERKRALCDKYETELSEARETEKEAKKEADIAASQKEQLEKKKKELQAQADAAVRKAQTAKALETASLNAARQGQRYATRHYHECKFQFKCYSCT
jgi:uncharacterized phage infection (PIP) family protein YhgE